MQDSKDNTNKIITTRFFESWWRRVQAWFVMTLATKKDLQGIDVSSFVPSVEIKDGAVIFHFLTFKQMEKVRILGEDVYITFRLAYDNDEEEITLLTTSDSTLPNEWIDAVGFAYENNVKDSISVEVGTDIASKIDTIEIDGLFGNLLTADATWRLAEIGNKVNGVAQESTSQEILEEVKNLGTDTAVSMFVKKFQEVGIDIRDNATLAELYDVVEQYTTLILGNSNFVNFNEVITLGDAIVSGNKIEELEILGDFDFPYKKGGFYADNKVLRRLVAKNVTSIGQNAFGACENLKYADLSSLITAGPYGFSSCAKLEYLDISSLQSVSNQLIRSSVNLVDLKIGRGFRSNIDFSYTQYNPTNAYSKVKNDLCREEDIEDYGQVFGTNYDKWKWCIINHFAANLQDRVGFDAFTITFGATVLAQFDEEMILAFTNKNWNLA